MGVDDTRAKEGGKQPPMMAKYRVNHYDISTGRLDLVTGPLTEQEAHECCRHFTNGDCGTNSVWFVSMVHVDYPHHPGTLYDCPACETVCYCTESSQCIHCAGS